LANVPPIFVNNVGINTHLAATGPVPILAIPFRARNPILQAGIDVDIVA
jgi:hypothetical protein